MEDQQESAELHCQTEGQVALFGTALPTRTLPTSAHHSSPAPGVLPPSRDTFCSFKPLIYKLWSLGMFPVAGGSPLEISALQSHHQKPHPPKKSSRQPQLGNPWAKCWSLRKDQPQSTEYNCAPRSTQHTAHTENSVLTTHRKMGLPSPPAQ